MNINAHDAAHMAFDAAYERGHTAGIQALAHLRFLLAGDAPDTEAIRQIIAARDAAESDMDAALEAMRAARREAA